MAQFKESILTLIVDTSTNLPPDIREAVIQNIENFDLKSVF
jgi:hypothetical protein